MRMRVCSIIRAGIVSYGLCALMSNTIIAQAGNDVPTKAPGVAYKAPGNYCGVSCLYILMRQAGIEVAYDELLKREYIGSTAGSSMAELEAAAKDHGLYAAPVAQLTKFDLMHCRYPVILHVRSSMESQRYDHYELFVGTSGGKARLISPPNAMTLVPFQELVPRWSGNGLIVSTQPVEIGSVLLRSKGRFLGYAVPVLACIAVSNLVGRRSVSSRTRVVTVIGSSLAAGAGMLVLAILCGMLYHSTHSEGLLANANATEAVQQAHMANFIPKINARIARQFLGRGTVFVDARFTGDYKAGHLPGAISVPVDTNDVQRRAITASLARDSKVVVYCQSKACQFAEKVALRMKEDGFSDVALYRGGWIDWVAKNGRTNTEGKS
jgi:rhodanese-related sulfurtransferase